MRPALITMSLIGAMFVLFGNQQTEQAPSRIDVLEQKVTALELNVSRIGDIRYSLLNPAQFAKAHGTGWRLLDGNSSSLTKDLSAQTGLKKFPDFRGSFVRSMNYGNQGHDPDKKRIAGSFQNHMIQSHQHKFKDAYWSESYKTKGGKYIGSNKNDSDNTPNDYQLDDITDPTGGVETRPKNNAAFCYIRVM